VRGPVIAAIPAQPFKQISHRVKIEAVALLKFFRLLEGWLMDQNGNRPQIGTGDFINKMGAVGSDRYFKLYIIGWRNSATPRIAGQAFKFRFKFMLASLNCLLCTVY
jgi:hypothetical protein